MMELRAGMSVAESCRKHGIGDATVQSWRRCFGVMEVSEAKRLNALEE